MFVEILTKEMISAGEELTRRLDKTNFIVNASLWFYNDKLNVWRLIIASPEVRTHGPKKSYGKIQSVISKMPNDKPSISLKDIIVVESNDPLISLLRVALKTGRGIYGIRFSRNTINGVFIEDVYIYRIT